jgi:putative endonuclease
LLFNRSRYLVRNTPNESFKIVVKNTNNKAELGRRGERLAAHYLEEQGFRILDRNWYFRKKEIDILAEEGRFLVVVEVKTRVGAYRIAPGGMISRRKQKFLTEAADAYLREYDLNREVRFDVVVIHFFDNLYQLEHIPDAFLPGE